MEEWERQELVQGSTFRSESEWGLQASSLSNTVQWSTVKLSYDEDTTSTKSHFDFEVATGGSCAKLVGNKGMSGSAAYSCEVPTQASHLQTTLSVATITSAALILLSF